MCEALICVKNVGNSGILAIDSHAPQQGDVIDVHPDGWGWGNCELGQIVAGNPNGNHNFFRIVKLPNVTVTQASTLLASELPVDPNDPSPYLQYRGFFLDASKIPAGLLKTYWNDDTRAQPFISLPYTAAQLNTLVTQRTPIAFTSNVATPS